MKKYDSLHTFEQFTCHRVIPCQLNVGCHENYLNPHVNRYSLLIILYSVKTLTEVSETETCAVGTLCTIKHKGGKAIFSDVLN